MLWAQNFCTLVYLTVPSTEALAMLLPDAENRQRLIGLVCPKKVSCKQETYEMNLTRQYNKKSVTLRKY